MNKTNSTDASKAAKVSKSTLNDLLYILTYEGVYRHEILGVFFNKDSAIKEAEVMIMKEDDGYHTVCIGTCPANTIVEDIENIITFTRTEKRTWGGEPKNPKTYKRVDVQLNPVAELIDELAHLCCRS